MARELKKTLIEELHPSHVMQTMADALPALGIVAAVLGVIKTMSHIDQPPAILGAMIGGALTGTFLGILLAYEMCIRDSPGAGHSICYRIFRRQPQSVLLRSPRQRGSDRRRGSEMKTIAQHVKDGIHTLGDLKDALQTAMQLEFSTCLLYTSRCV